MSGEANFTVTLSIYDWHKLLNELEYLRCICNREQESVEDLWEQISTQLSNKEQVVRGSAKHRRLAPELFVKKDPIKEEPIKDELKKEEPKKKTFWQYLNPFAKQ